MTYCAVTRSECCRSTARSDPYTLAADHWRVARTDAQSMGVNSRWSRSCPRSIQVGVYSQWRWPTGPWCDSEMRMSAIRSSRRCRETLASARASGAPAQVWMP